MIWYLRSTFLWLVSLYIATIKISLEDVKEETKYEHLSTVDTQKETK